MTPFVRLDAVAAPLPIANLDTDQIIPKQFLKTVERVGLGHALFFDLRFDDAGRERADFVLNQPAFRAAEVLVAGPNFGCGSSREHAVWALIDFGIRCVVAESFADIFSSNCFENGILPVVLDAASISSLLARLDGRTISVDLPSQTLVVPDGGTFPFPIAPDRKARLLCGVDAIDVTLAHEDAIAAYEHRRRQP